MAVTREETLRVLRNYLEGRLDRETVNNWADDIVNSEEYDKIATTDKLLADTIQTMWELHHEGEDERFNPGMEEFEYYRNCLEGKTDYDG